jgi:GntR family transcriptional regulator, transcriptional repressor for pyruvate dehydrogenase complex
VFFRFLGCERGAGLEASRALTRGNAAEQILEELRAQILSAALARGSRLPSEAKLAEAFGVSAATVREAIRGLTTSRLIEVRHGSGAFVTAQPDRVLAESLQAVIQIERISVAHVLGVLSALNTSAAEQAAVSATDEQLDELEAAVEALDQIPSDQDASTALLRFLAALATASGNPLLMTLCGFLAGLQVRLGQGALWRRA